MIIAELLKQIKIPIITFCILLIPVKFFLQIYTLFQSFHFDKTSSNFLNFI